MHSWVSGQRHFDELHCETRHKYGNHVEMAEKIAGRVYWECLVSRPSTLLLAPFLKGSVKTRLLLWGVEEVRRVCWGSSDRNAVVGLEGLAHERVSELLYRGPPPAPGVDIAPTNLAPPFVMKQVKRWHKIRTCPTSHRRNIGGWVGRRGRRGSPVTTMYNDCSHTKVNNRRSQ